MRRLPTVIQGGMGAGVSAWPLARAVALAGQLGVVAGTALDVILVRRLQLGDTGGHVRRALARMPLPGVAERILERWYVPGGKEPRAPFRAAVLPSVPLSRAEEELIIAANFVEVSLAREQHSAAIGINYLEKIQFPTLPALFGAMLAGVSTVLMGAGIPRAIPGVLDRLANYESVELPLDVTGATRRFGVRFDPRDYANAHDAPLVRPRFYAIVASVTMATVMCRKAQGRVDGLVIEGRTAGGHNAPPRGKLTLTATGEPVYGERDEVDLAAIAALGVPFWLAGSCATPERLAAAQAQGAAGIQVGTAFAFCAESGFEPRIKQHALRSSSAGTARLFTDPDASPTGFPFKVLDVPDSLSRDVVCNRRTRLCDLGFLREAYQRPDGELGWRCAGEPLASYRRKGGDEARSNGKKCVCNGLVAAIGLGQVRRGELEAPLVTAGDDVKTVARFLRPGHDTYTAADVVDQILGVAPATS